MNQYTLRLNDSSKLHIESEEDDILLSFKLQHNITALEFARDLIKTYNFYDPKINHMLRSVATNLETIINEHWEDDQ